MNLLMQPCPGLCLVATAAARPLDLAPVGQRGIELDNDALHERVLGADWREQVQAKALRAAQRGLPPLPEPTVRLRQWVVGADAMDLGTLAAQRALSAAGMKASELAAIICVTSSPPVISASMTARIGKALGCDEGLANPTCFDVRAGGVGPLLAWFTAVGLISQGAGPVLIIGAEAASAFMLPQDISSALLYGDGAGACILASDGGQTVRFLGGMSGQSLVNGTSTTIPGHLPPSGDLLQYRFHKPDQAHLADLARLWAQFPRELAQRFPAAAAQVQHFLPYAVSPKQMGIAHEALGQPQALIFDELATHGCLGAASSLATLHGFMQSGRGQPGDVIALASAAGNGLWAGFFWRLGA
jgi:3-oxoacyl-[acyl-carrier-protein] synthase III